MTDDLSDLRTRLDRLERSVQALGETVAALTASATATSPPPENPPVPAAPRVPPPARPSISPPAPHARAAAAPGLRALDTFWHGERWLNKLGIALLLLGVGFLGKYAIDRGWITPAVRVAACFAIGAALFAAGVAIHARRRALAQVLIGGGLAAFYVTGFVAFQLYALVPYAMAFAFLAAVTVLAFASALRQDEPLLAIVGTVGGLATPFLLYRNAGTIAGLAAYTSLIVAGVAAVYSAKRWRALLWAALAETVLVLAAGVSRLPMDVGDGRVDRMALQLGLGVVAIAYWALPVSLEARDRVRGVAPASSAPPGPVARAVTADDHVHLLPVVAPAFAIGGTLAVWSLVRPGSGWFVLAAAAVLAVVAAQLFRDTRTAPLGASHAVAAAGALTWALYLLLDQHAFLVALALEGLALHALARRLPRASLAVAGHAVFTIVGLAILTRLVEGPHGAGARATVANVTVVLLAFAASWLLASRQDAMLYRLAAHVGWLLWLWQTLGGKPAGKPLVTIAWGLHATALLPIGLRAASPLVVRVGFGTLVVTIAKLIFVDLADLDPIWRIGLFLGFGAVLLGVSYILPNLWRSGAGEGGERSGAADTGAR